MTIFLYSFKIDKTSLIDIQDGENWLNVKNNMKGSLFVWMMKRKMLTERDT